MAPLLLLSVLATAPPVCVQPAAPMVVPADTLRGIYESGVPFAEFLDKANRRRDQWVRNAELAANPDPALVARLRALGGTWRLLAVAPDGCSDSVNTIPWMAGLAAAVDNVELRVVTVERGQGVMDAHPTQDGRSATPTVVLLDADWRERGCFIERPRALRLLLEDVPSGERFERKMSWYEDDAGRETLADLVAMLEAAAGGGVRCE